MLLCYFDADLINNVTLNMLAAEAEGSNGSGFGLEDFTYRNNMIQAIVFRHLTETNFTGITVMSK